MTRIPSNLLERLIHDALPGTKAAARELIRAAVPKSKECDPQRVADLMREWNTSPRAV